MNLKTFIEWILEEDLEGQKAKRGEFLIKTYEGKWEGLPGYKDIKDFVEKLGEIDPSKNGAYMQWLAKLAIKSPDDNRTEDLDRVGKDLRTFEEKKSKIEKKDINAYKSYQELYDAVEPFYEKRPKTAEEKKAERAEMKLAAVKADVTIVYQGKEGWIRIPKTKAAAKFLGQSTRWCTSASANNMFDHYNKSDSLFVVYDKESKKRHQLHIDSGQFADEKDANQGFKAVPKWAWEPIKEWYKKNTDISLKQLMTLSKHTGDEELGKDSEHSDLLALMKEYGV
jgi:dsDNA-binding SOS-regulon protein